MRTRRSPAPAPLALTLALLALPNAAPMLYQYRMPLAEPAAPAADEPTASPAVMNATQHVATTEFISSTQARGPAEAPTPPPPARRGCPEEQAPANIGAYEVPSQRDLILLTAQLLLRMFDSYHEKQLYFLKDIKEATKATSESEESCRGARRLRAHRRCVRRVGGYSELLTKRRVTKLERRRADFLADMESGACEMAALRTDPVALMNSLAVELVSLEFALPGFLRLLNSCSAACRDDAFLTTIAEQPGRGALAMSNQDRLLHNIIKNSFYKEHKRGV